MTQNIGTVEKRVERRDRYGTRRQPPVSCPPNEHTDKQRDILMTTYKTGYFDDPRMIDIGGLAVKMSIHKTTPLQHQYKAEKRLVGRILDEER